MGTSEYSIREIAGDRSLSSIFFSNFITGRFLLSALAIVVGVTYALLVDHVLAWPTIVAAGTFVLTRNLVEYCRVFFRAFEDFRTDAMSTVLEKILVVGAGSLSLLLLPSSASVLAGMSAGMLLSLLIMVVWIDKRFASYDRAKLSLAFLRKSIRGAIPLGLAGTFVLLFMRTDSVMISSFRGGLETGLYGMAFRVNEALIMLPAMVSTILLPRLSVLYPTDFKTFKSVSYRSIIGLLTLGALVAATIYATSDWIITALDNSPDAAPAAELLKILIWSFPLSAANFMVSTALMAAHRQKTLAITLGIAAALNILLNLYLIPGSGAVGAAWATVATQVVVLVIFTGILPMIRASRTAPVDD